MHPNTLVSFLSVATLVVSAPSGGDSAIAARDSIKGVRHPLTPLIHLGIVD
jgi:hypothetical protein